MKALLYCTKGKPYLYEDRGIEYALSNKKLVDNAFTRFNSINGKIVAECDYEVEKITSKNLVSFEKESCLDRISMFKYLKPNLIWDNKFEVLLNTFGGLTLGYAIHIKNLHIFDEPRKLNDYYKFVGIGKMGKECINNYISIKKAPQNMMYAYEFISKFGLSGTWNRYFNGCIIISIHPEHLCKILNGEKTIEVRKKVLKCMKNKVN